MRLVDKMVALSEDNFKQDVYVKMYEDCICCIESQARRGYRHLRFSDYTVTNEVYWRALEDKLMLDGFATKICRPYPNKTIIAIDIEW